MYGCELDVPRVRKKRRMPTTKGLADWEWHQKKEEEDDDEDGFLLLF